MDFESWLGRFHALQVAGAPPWETLSAIDLNSGKYVWRLNLGEYPEPVAQGITNTGSENYGWPVVTDVGLLFI